MKWVVISLSSLRPVAARAFELPALVSCIVSINKHVANEVLSADEYTDEL